MSGSGSAPTGKTFKLDGLLKALNEDVKKVPRKAGGVSAAERKELADFYERELAKYAVTKHGGGKAFTNDRDEDLEADADDTELAAGSDDEDTEDEETQEDRDFIAGSESDAGSDEENDDGDDVESSAGEDDDDDDDDSEADD